MVYINTPVPGANQFYPLNTPAIGERLDPKNTDPNPKLFTPITFKNTTFKNRIFVSPMCQYSAQDGHATDWHLVHYGGFATRGVAAILTEEAAIVSEGRIAPENVGIWKDSHIDAWKRVVDFCHSQGTKIGLQISHAGRKASTHAPWVQNAAPRDAPHVATVEENGWPDNVRGPSTIPFADSYPTPKTLDVEELDGLVQAFVDAAHRSEKAGFDFIEIHTAHGYLLHEFFSPLSNDRTDEYGGSFENRIRFILRIVKAVREAWPTKPLFLRVSASDLMDGPEKGEDGEWRYWGPQQSTMFAEKIFELGIDLLDVSFRAGLHDKQNNSIRPGYQVPFAAGIKKVAPKLGIAAVGLIKEAKQAEEYLQEGSADVVFLGRELLRNPHWPLFAAQALGVPVKAANQYERAWYRP